MTDDAMVLETKPRAETKTEPRLARERERDQRADRVRGAVAGERVVALQTEHHADEERRHRDIEVREEELATAPIATGLLDTLPEAYWFLRTSGYLPGPNDIYVSLSMVRRFGLRKGDAITGVVRQQVEG